MASDLILGTAGHIDHGKTTLIKALTGTDTDRLPEEKKRGITIELGFAELQLGEFRLGIVDVPGHERFVRNMLAGATGIDLALLVVAADESVKPQTREHLEILRLLNLSVGVIALTKCDVPHDPDWIDLVEDEVRELVADTFLAEAPIIRTSATKGTGLEDLRGALAEAAAEIHSDRDHDGPMRMAIDRTFTIAGHGTVVTGSVSSGQAKLGDGLVLEPGGISVRIRGLENHGRSVQMIHRGQRAAINLAGVHHGQIQRGQELASPGHLVPSTLLWVRLKLVDSAARPLKNRARVRLHVGTAEVLASVVLLDCDKLRPGSEAFAQLYLAEPVVTTWRQAFILRNVSPMVTIGGGQILDPSAVKLRGNNKHHLKHLQDLMSEDPLRRASAALYLAAWRDWQPNDLARTAGVQNVQAVVHQLSERGELVQIAISPTRTIHVHSNVLEELSTKIERSLAKLHAKNPLQTMIDRTQLARRFDYLGSSALLESVLDSMHKAGRIELSKQGIALAGHGPQLSKNEQKVLDQIIETFLKAGCQPPTLDQIKSSVSKHQAAVEQLAALAVDQGRLVQISADFYLHGDVEQTMRETLEKHLAGTEGMTLSQIREILKTTRKYAVPICEYLDSIGFTKRHGDVRVLD